MGDPSHTLPTNVNVIQSKITFYGVNELPETPKT